jgi:EAL domain-containing protein (putative c-di-GMP-specific phosphodiesterase class I)
VIEDALRRALDREGEFHVLYQPIMDLRTGRMARAEALARWTSQEIGRVPPEKFIAVAERSGLIIEIGQRLLDIICADLTRHPELNVSVNFSPLQLQAPTFIPELIDLMHRRKIDTFRVEVELTEGVIVDNPEVAAFRLDLLNEAGFSTALDDFGTGYSSLGYLRHMPFNTLKIDRSFVSGIKESDPNADLIRAIAVLGHSMNQSVVAEGVETAAEVEVLKSLGCDMLQGFHFDRPLPIEVLAERWIDQKIEIAG